MERPVIGILAGMGPRSTSPFLELVLDQCMLQYGARQDIDFPPIMIYSLPTPFYLDRPIDHACMKETIADGLRKLESAGVDFIAMPCNSAHAYFKELERSINIPLLNIVEETMRDIPGGSHRVALLATPSTAGSGLYQAGFASAGHEYVPKPSWQQQTSEIIKMVKMKEDIGNIVASWNRLIAQIEQESVDTAIVACTDLNVALKEGMKPAHIVDSSESLAKATVKEYLARSKR